MWMRLFRNLALQGFDVGRREALAALLNVERDPLSFLQGLESLSWMALK